MQRFSLDTTRTPENTDYFDRGMEVQELIETQGWGLTYRRPYLNLWRNCNDHAEWRAAVENGFGRLQPWYTGKSPLEAIEALAEVLPKDLAAKLEERRRIQKKHTNILGKVIGIIGTEYSPTWAHEPEILLRTIVHHPHEFHGDVTLNLRDKADRRRRPEQPIVTVELRFGAWDRSTSPRLITQVRMLVEHLTPTQVVGMAGMLQHTSRIVPEIDKLLNKL